MSRRQSITLFTISALLSFIVLLLSLFIIDQENEMMPTLARMSQSSAVAEVSFTIADDAMLDANNQYVVQLDETTSRDTLDDMLTELDAEIISDLPQIQGAVVEFNTPLEPDQLETLSSAALIEPNYIVQSLFTYPTNDPLLDQQWAWQKIDIPRLWSATDQDADVTIAVIDSGVCFDHPDLQGRFLDNGFDFVDNDDNPSDEMGHGCAISGIIAAHIDNGIGIAGIAPHAKILPIRVLDAQGIGTYANVMSAIHYAVDNDADIINLSLGGQNYSQLLDQAVNYATGNGVHIVAGSGNTGQQGVLYPAKFENVIAVGSSDINGNRSTFSTYGDEVDTLAPGENIITTALNGGYSSFTGTSMAAPHVSALLALSDYSVDTVDLVEIMPTVDPFTLTMEAVQALEVSTNTPTVQVSTSTPLPQVPTNTRIPFQCSDLSLESAFFTGNYLALNIYNNGGSATWLEAVDIHFPAIGDYPDLYFKSLYADVNEIWIGDGTLTSPVSIDHQTPSFDAVDRWHTSAALLPQSTTTAFHLEFASGPDNLLTYWETTYLAGTTFYVRNPNYLSTPCEIHVPDDLYQIAPTSTPSTLQCSDLSVSLEFYPGGNFVFFHLTNNGNDTDLESIDLHFPGSPTYLSAIYIEDVSSSDTFWNGDASSISPVYMDYDTMSPDGLYHWQYTTLRSFPHNSTRTLEVQFLNAPSPLIDYWTESSFAGTTFSFYNPADPQSPCVLSIPEDLDGFSPTPTPDNTPLNPPYPECGTTGIELANVTNNAIYYQIENVATPHDYLVDMDHVASSLSSPISGTPSITNITFNGNSIWTGVSGTYSIDNGTWLSSPTLDNDVLGIHYNTWFDLRSYYLPEDFDSSFHVYNNIANDYCTIYPTVSSNLTEPDLSEPENLTAINTVSGIQLDWDMTASGEYDDVRIYRQISGVDNDFQLLQTFYDDTTSYLDTVPFVCSQPAQYKVQSRRWSAYQGQYIESQPALVNFTPSLPDCINLLPPAEFTATRVDGGVELNWTPANEIYNYHVIDRRIIGEGDQFSSVATNSIGTYTHNVAYECDVDVVEYRIRTRYHHADIGWRYSEPLIITYSEVCPQTDLELEITTNNSSPEPYTPVVITVTVRNTGDEAAHNLSIRQHDLAPYRMLNYTTSVGSYSDYWLSWSFNTLPAHSEETLTITLLAQQDVVTGEQPLVFEIRATDAIDPDSNWDNNDPTEDDYDAITLGLTCPTSDVFTVADGDTDGLLQAIGTANYETCFPGQDTITLAQDGSYTIDKWAVYDLEGWNAFPPISSDVVIKGNNSTIDGNDLVARLFYVTDASNLDLSDINITDVYQVNDFRGSIVFNHGSTSLDAVNMYYNGPGPTSYSLIENSGALSELRIANSYIGTANTDYAIVVGEGSSALIENSIITDEYIGVAGTLISRFSTYYNSGIGKIGDTRDVTLFGNVFDNLTGQYTCAAHVPAIIQEGVTSLGYNVSRGCSYGHPTDLGEFEDALVLRPIYTPDGDFRDYPKPTEDSPIIDLIPVEICDTNRDYTGAYRPQDSNDDTLVACNAGAYENDSSVVFETSLDDLSPSIGAVVTLSLELLNPSIFDVTSGTVNVIAPQGMTYLGTVSSTSGIVTSISNTQQWQPPGPISATTEPLQLEYRADGPFAMQQDSFNMNYSLFHKNQVVSDNVSIELTTDCGTDLHVYNIADGDVVAFAQAIHDANNEPCATHSHQINLAAGGDYAFTSALGDTVPGHSTLLLLPHITSDVLIVGDQTTLRADGVQGQLLRVETTGSLTLQGLILRDFVDDYASHMIRSYSDLSIIDTEIVDNNFPYLLYGSESYSQFLMDGVLIWNNFNTQPQAEITTVYFSSSFGDVTIRNSTILPYNEETSQYTYLYLSGNVRLEFNTFYNELFTTGQRQLRITSIEPAEASYFGNIFYNMSCSMADGDDSLGHNIINVDNSHCRLNHSTDIDYELPNYKPILLQPLLDHGGPTKVMYPISDSLGIDLIPPEDCTLAVDQRNFARPYNTNCDVGAVERNNVLETPTDLIVTPLSGTTDAQLSWTDNTSSEAQYEVIRRENSNTPWTVVATLPADTVSYIDSDVTCFVLYEYYVRAVNTTIPVYSDLSNLTSHSGLGCEPLQPPVLALFPVTSTAYAGLEIELSWTDSNTQSTGYELQFTKNSSTWTTLEIFNDISTQSSVYEVECLATYEYRLRALRDGDNAVSEWSNIVTDTAGACPSQPILLATSPTKSNQVTITWQGNTDPNYHLEIERRPHDSVDENDWNTITTVLSNTGQHTDTTPACDQTYQYRLRHRLDYYAQPQYSSYTASQLGSTFDCLESPINVNVSPTSETSILIAWQNITSYVDYEIVLERSYSGLNYWTEIAQLSAGTINYTDTDVTCQTAFDYRLRIYVSANDEYSTYSAIVSTTTDNCSADTPQTGSTFYVTVQHDYAINVCGQITCTLRKAIDAANANPGEDTIILADGIYVMQQAGVYEDSNLSGDYDIHDDLIIRGNDASTTIIDGAKLDRLFDVQNADVSLSIQDVTIQNGNDQLWTESSQNWGGLIQGNPIENLTLTNTVLQNGYGYKGGAIFISYANDILITNSVIKDNTARDDGGALNLENDISSIIIQSSTFDNNRAQLGYGGAIAYNWTLIYDSLFTNNVSESSRGGAIYGSGHIDGSTFIGNEGSLGGGVYYSGTITNSSFINNHATDHGGGLYIWSSGTDMDNLTISGNSADTYGGGIYIHGNSILNNFTIAENHAHRGGGLYNRTNSFGGSRIHNTIIANNTANLVGAKDCYYDSNDYGQIEYSLIESTSSCDDISAIVDTIFGVDPLLSELKSSGNTYYYEVAPGSPAINTAHNVYCLATDILNNARPIGDNCDMGAIESPYTLNPPTNLTGANPVFADVVLSWQDNSQLDTSVVVERSIDGANWLEIAVLAADAESYTDTTAFCPQVNYYRVSSRTASYTEYSPTMSVSVESPCDPLKFLSPISASIVDDSTAQITWSDDNADESGYRILRRTTGAWGEVGVVAPNLTLFNDLTIDCSADLTYDYQVQAYRDIDNNTALSSVDSVWTGDCPFYDPSGLTPTQILDEQVDLSWTDNSLIESSYTLSRKTASTNWVTLATLSANTTTYGDTTVVCESQYQYKLEGYQAVFDRATTAITTAVTTGQCEVAIPDAITTTVASSQTSIQWQPLPPQQTTQIIVERAEQSADAVAGLSGDLGLSWQLKATLGGGASAFTDYDLRCGMNYFYRLQGYNSRHNEYTGYSDTIQITTDECPVAVTNTIGVYREGFWTFRNGFEEGAQLTTFRFGPLESGWIPLTGDWDGDGIDGIGLYKDGVFALRDLSDRGVVDYLYRFGTGSGWQPIVGDWDGDGAVTVGLYREGLFMLTNTHDSPTVDYQFNTNNRESGWQPIAGDWHSYGRDQVGLYKDGTFYLLDQLNRNANVSSFRFGTGSGWLPIAGDWNADGTSTVGLYKDSSWRLRNSNSRGNVDIGFRFNGLGDDTYPLASYRGGEDAIEALALFATSYEFDVNPDATKAVDPTAMATLSPTIEAAISPTQVEMIPTITSSVSATVTQVEPTMMMPASATATQGEPIITATVEPTATAIPVEPTAVPSTTPMPTAIPATATPIPATEIPVVEPEATDEVQAD